MAGYRVSSGYGPRRAPLPGGSTYHAGIDGAAPTGTPVHAAAAGTVTRSEHNTVRGNVVVIDHGGWTTLYQHLDRRDVGRGTRVTAGQQIGTVGATGVATGPHLHLEERHAGVLRDPAHLVTAVMEGTMHLDDLIGTTNPAKGTPSTVGEALAIAQNYSFAGWQQARQAAIDTAAQSAQITNLIGAVAALSRGEQFDEAKLRAGIRADVEAAVKAAVGDSLAFDVTITPRED